MQVSIEKTTGLKRRMKVGVPAQEIESEVTSRLQEAAPKVRLDGFRKGKVPLKVVRQRFGAGIRQEVVGEVLNRRFQEAISQEEIRPAGQPSIDELHDKPGEDLEFVATFEVYPDIELKDFSELSVAKPVAEVTDADVEKMIGILREQHAEWTPVDRAAAMDDQVEIDYTGRKDGEEFEGGSAQGSKLVLGSGQMIPGFEDAIVGMSKGETKTVQLSFPEDYHEESLKGAPVEFDITVNEVTEKQLPELDDAFFAKFGVTDGGEETFREEVRNNMERELRKAVQNKVKSRLMEQLLAGHEVELPESLVQAEIQAMRRQTLSQFGGGQDFDDSLLPDELFAEEARKRVATGLIMARVVEVAGLKADPDQVKAHIEDLASAYEQPEEVVRYYYSNEQLLNSAESAVLEEQVVEHILDSAQLTEESCSYEEAIQPDPAPGQAEEPAQEEEGEQPEGEAGDR